MKLTELNGKENLPEKLNVSIILDDKYLGVCEGFDRCIDDYNQLEIDGDSARLGNMIKVYSTNDLHIDFSTYGAEKLAEHIISNLSKFLVIKKGG